jgi:hypothetical protein
MKRSIHLAIVLVTIVAAAAQAAVPPTISYQGVLTDAGGNLVPDGSYDMTFRIYDVASGGTALFTEPHTGANQVAVAAGGFSVILGGLVPLTLPFDAPYYLGVEIGAAGELAPRVPLTAGPYSLSLRLPFVGSASGSAAALRISNPGGGPAIQAEPRLDVGSPTSSADLRWYQSGSSEASGVLRGVPGLGGDIETFDELGQLTGAVQPDFSGEGGFLFVAGNAAGTKFMFVDGNDGAGNPVLELFGASLVRLDTGTSGDAAVSLPGSSVSAAEILDEPGISQGIGAAQVSITSNTTFQDAVTTTLTIPAGGYIVVEATSYVTHVFSTANAILSVQIDEGAGGGVDAPHNIWAGMFSPPDFTPFYMPVSARRTYFKSAGTYTFRLEARREGNTDGNTVLNYPVITATYYPTSRGAVSQIVSGDERSQFRQARPAIGANGVEVGSEVDLRELELGAARAEAEAERAQRQLSEARAQLAAVRAAIKGTTTSPVKP